MLGLIIAFAALALHAERAGQAAVAVSAPVNPNAHALFDRDVVLKQWAVRWHDRDRDGWLTLYEAEAALKAFKNLADGDRDGRVTTYEYDRAKEYIAAR